MIGQKTLYSFFSPTPTGKRTTRSPEPVPGSGVAAEIGGDAVASPAKKARVEQNEQGSPLSAEQLVRIQRNKAAALLRLAARNVPAGFGESWKQQLCGEFGKPYFVKLMGFVAEERNHHKVYPPPEQVFTWTQMCDIRDVKVVILGQDPYHGPNQAHGLCFSVQRPVPPPPSLENIFKELSTDIDGFVHPGHGDLSGWARQGVLLLNAVLTVRAHQANSHKERGWEQFTDAVVSWLNQNLSGLVFLLWGSYAQKKGSVIDRKRQPAVQWGHHNPGTPRLRVFQCFMNESDVLLQRNLEPYRKAIPLTQIRLPPSA
ncbi:uracil-DNA glycosylase isoform X1 [Mus musculus]|uniref:uracil-DNA glycosylase isoform X1 n=1 Tax=Mus musculus TaxID=10090 RepID=UPI0003D72945|nr:uracil-DNA glycosylase isoform X1 [Mus musculus]|eukprot:XP_006530347.1 PREDICTED: uracil-DNA glycosylase isoform X1 [Mus musculus]